ncbi:MAG: hypothetical protein ACOC5T_01905 [Elusimicrobiota bacterium]
MGGKGSGRKKKVETIIKDLQSRPQEKTPIATDIFLPNNSGDHSAGKTGTPIHDTDIANKKYVDDHAGSNFDVNNIVVLDGEIATLNGNVLIIS